MCFQDGSWHDIYLFPHIIFPILFSPYFPTFLPMTWGSQDISGHHDAPQAQNLGKPNSPAKALRSETCRQICDFGGPGVKLPSGKQTKNYGKSPFFIGKSSISMAIFNSKLLVDQRVQSTPPKKDAESCISKMVVRSCFLHDFQFIDDALW